MSNVKNQPLMSDTAQPVQAAYGTTTGKSALHTRDDDSTARALTIAHTGVTTSSTKASLREILPVYTILPYQWMCKYHTLVFVSSNSHIITSIHFKIASTNTCSFVSTHATTMATRPPQLMLFFYLPFQGPQSRHANSVCLCLQLSVQNSHHY
jgi:hypothetical protein